MLDLILTSKEGLVGNAKFKGGLGCSDPETVEFTFLSAERDEQSKFTTADIRRADFDLFGDLLGRVTWDKVVEYSKTISSKPRSSVS